MKIAIILGATGLTGNILINKLLNDDRYSAVKVFTRRSLGINHEKLQEVICDMLNLTKVKDQFHADEVYCCIGTTAKKTPSKELYKKIDYGIPLEVTKLCKTNDIDKLVIISSLGANSASSVFYNRTKGEMEQAVIEHGIGNLSILRPSIILGPRQEKRLGEMIGILAMKLFSPIFIRRWKKYRAIEAKTIAQAMINLCNSTSSSEQIIYESDIIAKIGSNN